MLAESAADWAASGIVELTGRQDGPALIPPGFAATRARQLGEYLAGVGVNVDGRALLSERARLTGSRRNGATSAGGFCRLLPSADGWAAVSCARPDDLLLLGALIGASLPPDPWPPLTVWLRSHSGAELAERAELLGVAAAHVPDSGGGGWASGHRDGPGARPESDLTAGRSVEGLFVVDFSALWAGPLCAHLLGLAGARVVKIETATRPDGARRGNPEFYRLLHAGHESVVVDPREDHRFLRALVERADIVIEASRPRALANWGLGPDMTGATWVSITAAGRASNRVGFGDDVAAGAGLVAWDAEGPVFVGDAIADPIAGLTAAARTVAARPGELVEVDMTAVVAATLDSPVDSPRVSPPERRSSLARTVRGEAAASGAHTAAVRRELRC